VKIITIAAILTLAFAVPSVAGENPNAKLALHVIASSDSLGCADLMPAACESIESGVSEEDLLAADGYGYILLLAYDIDSITGVEFALDGWPTGRGAPVLSGPNWCHDGLTLGDHEGEGGITAFGTCVEPDTASSLAALAYWSFGPVDSTYLPI